MSQGRFTDRQRNLLEQLGRLAEDRVKSHAMSEQRRRTALATADEQRDSALETAQETAEKELQEERARHRVDLDTIRTKSRDHEQQARSAWDSDREAIGDKADHNDQEARRKMDEAIWLAETVYEAHQEKPEHRFAAVETVLDGMKADVHAVLRQSRERVAQFRQRAVLEESATTPPADLSSMDERTLETELTEIMERVRADGLHLVRLKLPRLFRGLMLPSLTVIILGAVGGTVWGLRSGVDQWLFIALGGTAVALILASFSLFVLARRSVRRAWGAVDQQSVTALALIDHGIEIAAARQSRDEKALLDARETESQKARSTYQPIIEEIAQRRVHRIDRVQTKYPKLIDKLSHDRDEQTSTAERRHSECVESLKATRTRALASAHSEHERRIQEAEAEYEEESARLARSWFGGMDACAEETAAIKQECSELFPPWSDPGWESWVPPTVFAPSIPFGRLTVDRNHIPGSLPEDEQLCTDVPQKFDLPATLDFPDNCSMLLITDSPDGRDKAIETLRATMLRLLTSLPPGKVRFTIIDPVSLGESFAAFMHLADYDEAFVSNRIWTEPRHIEQRLTDITEHMENVIQKYLRNEFDTIAEYNEQAGEIAEPYRFLVISDMAANLTETAAKRLASIVSSGARCGVYTLLHLDRRQPMPTGMRVEDLEVRSSTLQWRDQGFVWQDDAFRELPIEMESFPDDTLVNTVLHKVGEASKDATRVEVPFAVISPGEGQMWSRDSAKDIRVPLGRCGATKLQELSIGPGTSQHALIAGKTGSGKSTLLHVLITNLALWYSPEQVQFYLVDFKKGVEFKTYATQHLPHACAVAVESDREFGLSVLHRIDSELKRRGDAFRGVGVQDLAGFRERSDDVMPRILLIVDEFQELFVEDDKIGQDAALLLDRIVRQGRAFGIHVLLGSQTLGGAYSLARSTMGQMQVRIALQCSEADSYLIMSDDNSAARLLSRPGEAIYNDAGGRIEGNSPFQACWLPDRVREVRLAEIRTRAKDEGYERPDPTIVFEGNIPADLAGNHLLAAAASTVPEQPVKRVDGWLGEAIAIKGPTCAGFRRQSGSNLLIVGQRDESALAMTQASLLAIAAQSPTSPITLLDGSPVDSPWAGQLTQLLESLPNPGRVVAWRDVDEAINDLAEVVQTRSTTETSDDAPAFLFIFGLQRFRQLRAVDDFSFSSDADAPPKTDKLFGTILCDGPPVGVHTFSWCDTATNLSRTLERQGLREFEMRVLFQMSGADSTQLIDSPIATKLGMQRAMFYNEELGLLEKFRPYALPDRGWADDFIAQLARR